MIRLAIAYNNKTS